VAGESVLLFESGVEQVDLPGILLCDAIERLLKQLSGSLDLSPSVAATSGGVTRT
jgi:hypothetical protein